MAGLSSFSSHFHPRIRLCFSSRHGGVSTGGYASFNLGDHVGDNLSNVQENRHRASCALGAPVAFMQQVHGDHLVILAPRDFSRANDGIREILPATDGIILDGRDVSSVPYLYDERGVSDGQMYTAMGACVMVADCVPLLLAGIDVPIAAAVHVGRAGLWAGIAGKTVSRMREMGAERIFAWIGPSICGSCYEVPRSMARKSQKLAPHSLSHTAWGTPSIDIPRSLAFSLRELGVEVEESGICTRENNDYFSYRRAGERSVHLSGDSHVASGECGRFGGFAVIDFSAPESTGYANQSLKECEKENTQKAYEGISIPFNDTRMNNQRLFPLFH